MNELYNFSNQFYLQFESLKSFGKNKYWYIFGSALAVIAFFASIIYWVIEFYIEPSFFSPNLLLIIIIEIVMIITIDKFRNKKRQYILEQDMFKTLNIKTIDEAKLQYLKEYFRCSQSDLYNISEKISKSMESSKNLANEKSTIETFFNFIYNMDATQRVLSLFVVLCSIVLILSVNTGQNLHTVLETFDSVASDTIIKLYFTIVFITLAIGWGIVFMFKILRNICLYFSLIILARYERNIGTVNYLLRDLNNLCSFRAPIKDRVQFREKANKAFKRN